MAARGGKVKKAIFGICWFLALPFALMFIVGGLVGDLIAELEKWAWD
jgi:hypothetical protein